MLSRVISIRRLLYGHPAPAGSGRPPVRLAASGHPAPTVGAIPDRSAQARSVQSTPPGVVAIQELASTGS